MNLLHYESDEHRLPLATVWALNITAVVVGFVALVRLGPLTFSAALACPLGAFALHVREPDRFLLGDTFSRGTRIGQRSPTPLGALALMWSAPGFLLALRGLTTPPTMDISPSLIAGGIVGILLAIAVLLAEWRLRGHAATKVILICMIVGWGYVTAANQAFDRAGWKSVEGAVQSREIVGKRGGGSQAFVKRGTPTLYLILPDGPLRLPVSRAFYDDHSPGSLVCLKTKAGAFGWRTARATTCPSEANVAPGS